MSRRYIKELESPAEEWTDGRKSRVSVRLADFVSEEDSYLLRVAWAARKVLAGERLEPLF